MKAKVAGIAKGKVPLLLTTLYHTSTTSPTTTPSAFQAAEDLPVWTGRRLASPGPSSTARIWGFPKIKGTVFWGSL